MTVEEGHERPLVPCDDPRKEEAVLLEVVRGRDVGSHIDGGQSQGSVWDA